MPFRFALALALMLSAGASAAAGTLIGVVHNGTSGAPGAGLDVILLQLREGMQPVATTRTDAQGRFRFDRPEIGASPMLVRVPYRGVNYHQPVPPGTPDVEVEVYEPTQDPTALTVTARALVLQPKDSMLLIGEEYTIENLKKPPVAYYRADGTFEFSVPQGGQLNQVSAWGSSGMPLVQGTIEKGKNREAIAFPFRPGENGVRLSYQIPYPASRAALHTSSPYATQRLLLVAPPTVQVTATGFEAAGSEQGWNLYARESVPADTPLDIFVSGAAASPSTDTSAGVLPGNPQDSSANSRAGAGGESAQVLPGRLESLKWVLIGGFAALFLLGVVLLWRRPQPGTVDGSSSESKRGRKAQVVAERDREIRGSLGEVKETLFKLELRKQAGTISEEEYARQRSRAERILRDLVRG